jgi:hypothetical protein
MEAIFAFHPRAPQEVLKERWAEKLRLLLDFLQWPVLLLDARCCIECEYEYACGVVVGPAVLLRIVSRPRPHRRPLLLYLLCFVPISTAIAIAILRGHSQPRRCLRQS